MDMPDILLRHVPKLPRLPGPLCLGKLKDVACPKITWAEDGELFALRLLPARMDYLMLIGIRMYTAYIQCVRYLQRLEGDGGRQPFVLVCPGVHTESR